MAESFVGQHWLWGLGVGFHVTCGCLHGVDGAELDSCIRNGLVHKADSIYSLALYGKSLLTHLKGYYTEQKFYFMLCFYKHDIFKKYFIHFVVHDVCKGLCHVLWRLCGVEGKRCSSHLHYIFSDRLFNL